MGLEKSCHCTLVQGAGALSHDMASSTSLRIGILFPYSALLSIGVIYIYNSMLCCSGQCLYNLGTANKGNAVTWLC